MRQSPFLQSKINYNFNLHQISCMKSFSTPNERLEDKQFLEKMNEDQRKNYLKAMLKTPQIDGDLSKIKRVKFPNQASFQFDNHRLNYNFIEVSKSPKAILFYFHGMYCNSNNGGLLGQIVSKNTNMNVYGLDFINAGQSQSDEPGYYKSVDYLVEQAYAFIQLILEKFQNQPKVFICGLSMGGLVSFYLSVKYPKLISGTVFLAPALRQIYLDKYIAKKIGRVLTFFAPKARLVPQTFDTRTRMKMEDFLKQDKQNYIGNHVFATAKGVLEGMKWASQNYKKLQTPYIMIQGGVDKHVDPFAVIDLQKESQTKDKTSVIFKDMWHELHHEVEYEEICQMVAVWLKERI